jgi:hypothetical protein
MHPLPSESDMCDYRGKLHRAILSRRVPWLVERDLRRRHARSYIAVNADRGAGAGGARRGLGRSKLSFTTAWLAVPAGDPEIAPRARAVGFRLADWRLALLHISNQKRKDREASNAGSAARRRESSLATCAPPHGVDDAPRIPLHRPPSPSSDARPRMLDSRKRQSGESCGGALASAVCCISSC